MPHITVKEGTVIDADLRDRLFVHVREIIYRIATPDVIHFANALPKTRSGKITRRILRKSPRRRRRICATSPRCPSLPWCTNSSRDLAHERPEGARARDRPRSVERIAGGFLGGFISTSTEICNR